MRNTLSGKNQESMNVWFFSRGDNPYGNRLLKIIASCLPEKKIQIIRSVKKLLMKMRQPGGQPAILVLCLSSTEELLQALVHGELLVEYRLIVILPDSEEETIARGHALRPRFIACANQDLMEIPVVVSRMMKMQVPAYD